MNKIAGFSERLSEIMRDFNINMSDMAKRAGTSKQSISRYIAGDRQPKTDKVDAIAFDPYTHGYYRVSGRVGEAFKDGLKLK